MRFIVKPLSMTRLRWHSQRLHYFDLSDSMNLFIESQRKSWPTVTYWLYFKVNHEYKCGKHGRNYNRPTSFMAAQLPISLESSMHSQRRNQQQFPNAYSINS